MLHRSRNRALEVIDSLVAEGRASFTFQEAVERFDRSPSGTAQALKRLEEKGLVERVRRGRYAIRRLGVLGTRASSEDIALAVAAAFFDEPHRIAYLSALDDHDLLTRPVRVIHVATTKRIFGERISGRPFKAFVEPEERIGVGSEFARHAWRSELERALLESAARPDVVGITLLVEALSAAKSKVDLAKLTSFTEKLDLHAAYRRIGSIVDALELEGLAGNLSPLKPPRSDLDLEPAFHEETVWRDKKWMVRWGQAVSELAAVARS